MDKAQYQVGTAKEVRAVHLMPGVEGLEGQLHARLPDRAVGRRATLDEEGIVCHLDLSMPKR